MKARVAAQAAPVQDWSPELQKSRVYESMLLDIVMGELAPDAWLDEDDLVKRYDAGLAGVREALSRLALEGLVLRRPRVGTVVAPLDDQEMREALEARGLIEPACAALAAERASEAELDLLCSILTAAEAAARAGDLRALVVADRRFHATLASAAGNGMLERIVKRLQIKSARYWIRQGPDIAQADFLDALARHRAVVDRLRARDAVGAREAMAAAL